MNHTSDLPVLRHMFQRHLEHLIEHMKLRVVA